MANHAQQSQSQPSSHSPGPQTSGPHAPGSQTSGSQTSGPATQAQPGAGVGERSRDIRVSVFTEQSAWSWEGIDEWSVMVLLASLSADPVTVEELRTALRRYQDAPLLAADGRRIEGWPDAERTDGHWCLVDLHGRSLVMGPEVWLPSREGNYQAEDGEEPGGFGKVWLNVARDWLWETASEGWVRRVTERFEQGAERDQLDVRAVLFGEPLLRDVAVAILASLEKDGLPAVGAAEADRDCELHRRWVSTPLAELGGRSPKDVMVAQQRRLDTDMEGRRSQWVAQKKPPVCVPRDSAAYRHAGFSTNENVIHFNLLRELLVKAWEVCRAGGPPDQQALVKALREERDRWMDHEWEGYPETPAMIQDAARRRMPLVSLDDHLPGSPAFIYFDAFSLEYGEAFEFYP